VYSRPEKKEGFLNLDVPCELDVHIDSSTDRAQLRTTLLTPSHFTGAPSKGNDALPLVGSAHGEDRKLLDFTKVCFPNPVRPGDYEGGPSSKGDSHQHLVLKLGVTAGRAGRRTRTYHHITAELRSSKLPSS
jgi:hypothetical protein